MKKFFSLVLALVMALSLTTVAWGTAYPSCTSCTDPTHVAAVGTTHYDDLQDAITAAASDASKTVTLLQNVPVSLVSGKNYCLLIDAPITFDGNGKALTYSGSTYDSRVINISTTGNVVIKNLTLTSTGERGFNVIEEAVNLTLTNVTATAGNYTVNVAKSAGAANVTITGSTLTGRNTVNVAAPGAVIAITGGTIVCNDPNSNPPSAGGESYGALFLTSDATGAKITASGVTFDIKHDSSKAINAATDGQITIDNNAGAAVMVAEIKYGAYSYVFPTVQDAIDHAVNEDGASASNPVEVIVLPAAVNSGESFTVPAGVELELPADADLVDNGVGGVIVATATGNAVAPTLSVWNNAATAWEVTYVAAGMDLDDLKQDASDNCLPCYLIDGEYFVQAAEASATYKLVYGAKTVYLAPVDASDVKYEAKASVYSNVTKKTDVCGKLVITDTTATYYASYDEDLETYTYYVGTKNGSKQILVGGKIVDVELNPVQALTAHVWKGNDVVDHEYTTAKCENCGKVAKLYATGTAAGKGYHYEAGLGYITKIDNGFGASSSVGSTDKTVTSAETFDAGIAMYVGMSVMAATGSAVVIGKKKD